MKPTKAIPISAAATFLGVGPRVLFRELRERGVLDAQNYPAKEYIESGELSQQQVQYNLRGQNIKKYRLTPTVTVSGWPLLETIARDIRHGHEPKSPEPTVTSEDNSAAAHLSAEESHQRCAGIMQILTDDACPSDIRAA